MSPKVINNEKYEVVQNVYGDLKDMIDRYGFDLLEDDHLKSIIYNRCEKFKIKMDSKTTVGIIFDSRSTNSSLIDALIEEHVSGLLGSDDSYLVKGDRKSKKVHAAKDLNKVKYISVPTKKWEALENSVIHLCSKNYQDYLVKMIEKDEPDVVVLVVNTPEDLRSEHIKSFLSKTGQTFNDGNFFLVLNDARVLDCAALNSCKACYPEEIRKFLKQTDIKFEDRYFQISSSKYLDESVTEHFLDDNFRKLKKAFEVELDINTVIDRFYKDAEKIGTSMKDIQKSFDDKKTKDSINQMSNKLEDNSPIIKETIDIYKKNTNQAAEDYLNENSKNNNDAVVGDLMKPFFDDKINQLNEELKEKIDNLIEMGNEGSKDHDKFKNILNDIFFNQNFKKDDILETVNLYLNTEVMQCKMNQINKQNKSSSALSHWRRLMKGTKTVVAKICKKAKIAYHKLVKTFKKQTKKLLEALKNTMDHAIHLLRNDFLQTFMDNSKKLITKTENEQKKMLNTLFQSTNSIEAMIRQKDEVDIYDHNIGHHVGNAITDYSKAFCISNFMDQLYSKMRSFGYNKFTTDLCNEFTDIYRDKYSTSDRMRNFDNLCRREFCRFQELIDEDRFYDYRSLVTEDFSHRVDIEVDVGSGLHGIRLFSPVTALVLGGVTGAAVGLTAGSYGTAATKGVSQLVENIQNQNPRKFIKTSKMIGELTNLKVNIRDLIMKTIPDISKNINQYLEYMKSLKNLQN